MMECFSLYIHRRVEENLYLSHDPRHGPNKPERVRFVRGFRKTIISKPELMFGRVRVKKIATLFIRPLSDMNFASNLR